MKSSISALPGPVSQAIGSGPPSTKVTLATPPILSTATGCGRVDGVDDGAMKHRHERRALPAGRDVGRAEVVHHRNAEPLRQRRAVADLDGELALRPVEHGLAVEADHGDVRGGDAIVGQQPLDRLGMGARGQRLAPRAITPGRASRSVSVTASASACRSTARSGSR